MKIFFSIFFILYATLTNAQPQRFKLRFLESYYLDEHVPLKRGLNFMVISNEKVFKKYFGDYDIDGKPNFDFEYVLVLAMPPTKKRYTLSLDTMANKAGNFIEVYYSVTKKKHKLTYLDHPIVVAAIPQYFSVTKINFYNKENNKMEKSVMIKR